MPGSGDEQPGRAFLLRILAEGSSRLGAVVTGQPVFSWRDRAIGAAAIRRGESCWMRATGEHRDWAGGPAWTGARDANALRGIPRPELLGQAEWTEGVVEILAQAMALAPGKPCSSTPELREELALPDAWWTALSLALDRLGGADSRSRPGRDLVPDQPQPAATSSTTAHGDLHWANLMAPELCIVDWEHWGPAQAGLDAATLYCHSLLVPPVAARVHEVFADTLEAPSGRAAQLRVIAHLLRRADGGDYPDLAPPLRGLAARLADIDVPDAGHVH